MYHSQYNSRRSVHKIKNEAEWRYLIMINECDAAIIQYVQHGDNKGRCTKNRKQCKDE